MSVRMDATTGPIGPRPRPLPLVESAADGPVQRIDGWEILGPGEGGPAILPTISPHDPNVVIERSDMSGSYITHDGGRSWRMFNLGSGVCAFAFDPIRPAVIYAGTVALWRSEDFGRTWSMVFPDPSRNTVEHVDGDHVHLTLTTDDPVYPVAGHHVAIQAIAVDPTEPQRIYIVFGPLPAKGQEAVLLVSEDDGGRSWAITNAGLPSTWRRAANAFAHDSAVNGLIWGVFASVHDLDLPRPKMWRHRDPDTYEGGVAVSTDGGSTWRVSNEGMPPAAVTHLLLDPESPVSRRTLYACAFGKGVFKSTDHGRSWTQMNRGLEGRQPFAWRLTLSRDRTLYLVVARRNEDGSIGNEKDGALYASRDGAESWSNVSLPAGCNGPTGLAVDSDNPDRLYLAAWGRYNPGGDLGGRVYLSTDRGRSWQCLFDQGQHVYDVTIDPNDAARLYVCGFDSGAWRSEDRGRTWTQLRGYNFKWGHRVIPDPTDPGKVFITTYGGGIWHGSAGGDPAAPEYRAESIPLTPARISSQETDHE